MKLRLLEKELPSISLEEVKLYLRVLHDEEDQLIASLLAAAVDRAEQLTGRALSIRTYELFSDNCESIALPYPPLQAVLGVEALDEAEYKPISFDLDDKATPPLVTPDCDKKGQNCLRVRYKCGYEQIPEAIKSWVFVQVATLYEHRLNIVEGSVQPMPRSFVDHLLDSYRVRQI